MTAHAIEVTVSCPCCRENVRSASDVYRYARAYLCDMHQRIWRAEDVRQHARGKCPWYPRPCWCHEEEGA